MKYAPNCRATLTAFFQILELESFRRQGAPVFIMATLLLTSFCVTLYRYIFYTACFAQSINVRLVF